MVNFGFTVLSNIINEIIHDDMFKEFPKPSVHISNPEFAINDNVG